MKEKIMKMLLIGAIICAYKVLYAPDELKKEGKEGGQIQWVEPTRGWDENGTYLWTGVSPLPSYNVGIGTSTPAYKLDVVGNSRIQGDLYINSWPIRVTSAPPVGYVLKWNGSAFVPQEDAGVGDCEWLDAGSYLYPRDLSAGDVRVYEDATSAQIVAIQTNSSYCAIAGAFSNGPFGQLGSSDYGVYGRYVSGGTLTNMYGYIGLNVWGVYGNSDNTSGAGVGGFGGTTTTGVYGQTNTSAVEAGVFGVNINASGTGIIGLGSNVTSIGWSGQGDGVVGASDAYGVIGSHYNGSNNNRWGALGTPSNGVYGTSDNTQGAGVFGSGGTVTTGVYGVTNTSNYFGVEGVNTNASGSGVLGLGSNVSNLLWSGQGDGVVGASDAYGVIGSHYNGSNNNRWGALGTPYNGVYGSSDNTSGAGVFGDGGTVTTGVYGRTNVSNDYGVWGFNLNASGTGIVGAGNNASSYYLNVGSGGAFTGTSYGVVGFYTTTSGQRAGGYFRSSDGSVYAYVAFVTEDGANYKIVGTGSVSTIMKTRGGEKTLFAPESPEAWFIDYGEGQLKNGRSGKINLDPYFLDCVTINEKYNYHVFIQLYGDCNGVYVKRYPDGFEVIELNGGKSNASFSYMVIAKWKGYEHLRFPDAPEPLTVQSAPHPKEIPAIQQVSIPKVKVVESVQTVKVSPKYSVPPAEFKGGIKGIEKK